MIIEDLSLGHKDLLHARLRGINTWISEYSFPNLYLFRKNHRYRVIRDQELLISGITYDGVEYIMPTCDVRSMDARLLKDIVARFGCMYPVPEEWLEAFPEDTYRRSFSDSDTDYVHHLEKLKTYSGKRLHDKKNLLNQFMKKYRHEALPLTADRLPDAMTILEAWQRDVPEDPGGTDYHACREAIELYDELILCGGIYYVEDAPAGFIIGEELHDQVFALHFAKGIRGIKGLYQFMFSNFASIMPSKYCCFNFEQDMGKESLRQAKATYEPEHMIRKYRLTLF